jgi:hypothetical protein
MASWLAVLASAGKWVLIVAGIEVLLVSFWLIFLGFGLMHLSSSHGLSLLFPGITGLWRARLLKSQWHDFIAERRKLARSKEKA